MGLRGGSMLTLHCASDGDFSPLDFNLRTGKDYPIRDL